MSDYTGPNAASRVLHLNLWVFKYGTDDKAHAAAIILSFIQLACIMLLFIFAASTPAEERFVSFLESGFLLTAGVAIGQSGAVGGKKSD